MQPDLFATLPAGLAVAPDIVNAAEERALSEFIDASGLEPFRFQQWTGHRLTRSFGWHYDFAAGRLGTTDPIPPQLSFVCERAARFAGLPPDALVQALLIRYDPGAGIGWHRDRPVFGHVIGISLGASAALRLRRRHPRGFDRASAPLPGRSIYHLAGEARSEWEHSIVPIAETRWSITFRTLA